MRGIGVAVITRVSGSASVAFLHQLKALQHAETVLFVHNDQPGVVELNFFLDQGVRSDYQVRVAFGDVAAACCACWGVVL